MGGIESSAVKRAGLVVGEDMAASAPPDEIDGWTLSWVLEGRRESRPLRECGSVPFEEATPVRRFGKHEGQPHYPGLFYSTTSHRHLPYESLLERDVLRCLDFDPHVTGLATQPMVLRPGGRAGRFPDIAVRRSDGTLTIVDVCRRDVLWTERRVQAHRMMRTACDALGWRHEVCTEPDPIHLAAVSTLVGYRGVTVDETAAEEICGLAADPIAIDALLAACGDDDPGRVAQVLSLLWQGRLHFDVSAGLDRRTAIRRPRTDEASAWRSDRRRIMRQRAAARWAHRRQPRQSERRER